MTKSRSRNKKASDKPAAAPGQLVAVVTCRCIGCGASKDVRANEIPPDEMPMCEKCFNPMVAESARAA